MSIRTLVLVSAVAFSGCAVSFDENDAAAGVTTVTEDAVSVAQIDPVEAEPCGMVFSPVPELLDATVAQAARWSVATGCDIRVGEGGVPVVIAEQILAPDGTRRRGVAREESGVLVRIEIERATAIFSNTLDTILGHEIGHVLGAHAHAGCLMASPVVNHAPICAADLEAVCASLACSAFNPEG